KISAPPGAALATEAECWRAKAAGAHASARTRAGSLTSGCRMERSLTSHGRTPSSGRAVRVPSSARAVLARSLNPRLAAARRQGAYSAGRAGAPAEVADGRQELHRE